MPLQILGHKLKEQEHQLINFQQSTAIGIKQQEFIVCNTVIVILIVYVCQNKSYDQVLKPLMHILY